MVEVVVANMVSMRLELFCQDRVDASDTPGVDSKTDKLSRLQDDDTESINTTVEAKRACISRGTGLNGPFLMRTREILR